jgi:hypothetical protein
MRLVTLASKTRRAARRTREQQDAVAEHQPVAAGVQLAGQQPVLRQDRAEQREAVEGGVGGQDEDARGHRLHVEERAPSRRRRPRRDLRDDAALHVVVAEPDQLPSGSST